MYQIIEVIGMPKRQYHKIWLIMRLTTVILIACLMQVSAAGLAQKITLNQRDVPLSNVLKEIRKQSGFDVFSEGKGLPKNQKVTVVVTNASIEEALDQAFKGLGYTYKIDGKTIAIKPKDEASFFDRMIDRFQAIDVTGKIVDESGEAIAGATIKVKGTSIQTNSGSDGSFSLKNVADDATLEITYIGFQTKEIRALKQLSTITLQVSVGKLEEVTVNAGYYTVKDSERTGSISKITSKDIEKQPVSNPLASMQGRMSGVNITQSAGTPGSGFSIQIRGLNSIRGEGNDPLYIVNGVPYASQSLGNSTVSNDRFGGLSSPLSNINPADIENIEVLKDADATAIYGSRGANGVVLITTKKGKAGKTKFDVQSYTSVGKITRKTDLLNTQQYLSMRREAFSNDGITTFPADAYDVNGTWSDTQETDWQKVLIGGTANIYNTQATISGGSSQTQYLLSGTYRKETTVFPGDSHFNRGAVHMNLNHRSENDRFKLTFSADYSGDKNSLPGIDLTRQSYVLAPNAPTLYEESGNLNWANGSFENPLGFLNGSYLNKTNTLLANSQLSYKFDYGFEFRTSLGYSDTKLSEKRLIPSTMYSPFSNYTTDDSSIFGNDGTRSSWIIEPQLNWQKKWELMEINILAGTTFQTQKQEQLAVNGIGFSSNALINSLTAATTVEVLNDDFSEYKYNAFFGRINVNLLDKYILNLTGRRDGSSRFGPENRFANFGAVGAAWIFSKEPFLKDNFGMLSFGKIRSSYGITGNDQIGDYQYLDTYQVSQNEYDGMTGIQPTRLFNPNFGWETNRKFEVAVELGFLNDKLFLSAAWFQNRSSNQLVGIPLPGTTGFPALQANLDATVENKGFELEWRTVNFKSKDFNWTTMFNLTIPKNKLLKFPGLETSTYKNLFVIGKSLNIQKLYHYDGIDPNTGFYKFMDFNGDGEISSTDDRNAIVDTSPKYYGGLTNQLSYRNWTLDFLFQFVKQDALGVLSAFPHSGTFSNQPTQVLNHFPQNGATATVQKYATGSNSIANQAQDRYTSSDAMINDASFIRLKSTSVSYSIPALWSKSISGKIYLQGQNLLTFTNYKGADPENKSTIYLPPLKQFTLGIQLFF